MDKCEILYQMRWTKSISMRQYEHMSMERGFAESIEPFFDLFVFIYAFIKMVEDGFIFVKYMGGDIKDSVNIAGCDNLLRCAFVDNSAMVHQDDMIRIF